MRLRSTDPVSRSDVPVSPDIKPAAPQSDVPSIGPQGTLVVPIAVHVPHLSLV